MPSPDKRNSADPSGVERLLLSHGKTNIWAHSLQVAEQAASIASRFSLSADTLALSGRCHDVGGILTAAEMLSEAETRKIALDPAEIRHPFLLHQRFSRILCAERLGVVDERVLSAVGCHTTLKPNASPYDMALFLADKLCWDQPGEPPFRALLEAALHTSLELACLVYIDYALENELILTPHRWLIDARCWLCGFEMAN